MLAGDWDRLRWGDVVGRGPLFFARTGVEVFLHELLPPRESIASAHQGDYGRSYGSVTPDRLGRSMMSVMAMLRQLQTGACFRVVTHPFRRTIAIISAKI